MISFIIIVSVVAIFFLPIVAIILALYVGFQDKTKWEDDNGDAYLIHGGR